MNTTVSVVLPTYNRAATLAATLPSYLCQRDVGEVIIVDDGSTDETAAMVAHYSRHSVIPVHYVPHSERMGQPASRNTGTALASYPFVFYGEDDLIPENDHVRVLVERAHALEADVIAGRIVYLMPHETIEQATVRYSQHRILSDAPIRLEAAELRHDVKLSGELRVPFVHGVFLTRTQLAQTVKFDVQYTNNAYREETDYHVRVSAGGGKVFLTNATSCYHLARSRSPKGGHHTRHWLIYDYWTIRNNCIFIDKNYSSLCVLLGWSRPRWQMKLFFGYHRLRNSIFPRLVFEARESMIPFIPQRLRSERRRLMNRH